MLYLSNNKKANIVLYISISAFILFALFVYFQISKIGGVMLIIGNIYLIVFLVISNIKFKKDPTSAKVFFASNNIVIGILMMIFTFGIIFLQFWDEKGISKTFTIDQILSIALGIYLIIYGRKMLKMYNNKKQEEKK